MITLPLAFGEGDTRSRIQNVLNWKRPRTWVVLLAAISCVVVVAACGVNPVVEKPYTGTYPDMDACIAALIDAKGDTRELYLADPNTDQIAEEPTAFPIISTSCENLEQLGQQPELSPEGTLTVWKFDLIPQIDLGPHRVDEIFLAGGSYIEEDGRLHAEGSHITVTLTYPDGSIDLLHDNEDFEGGMSFLSYHDTWEDALYDWYVQENHLEAELPLLVMDWHDQVTTFGNDAPGNFPIHRRGGNGWYLYIPIVAWSPSQNDHPRWESAYGTGSQLTVYHADHSAQEEADALVQNQDGSSWERMSDAIPHVRCTEPDMSFCMEDYYFDDPQGGSWCVRIEWNPSNIAAHWSPNTKTEPELLHLMAESFTTNERFFLEKEPASPSAPGPQEH